MKINKKRQIKSKTDYRKRLILLKGRCPRLVVRKTNRYLIIQIITSKNAQDFVESSVNTKELLKYGWPDDMKGSLKSISAGYLAGILISKKIKIKDKIILDSGLIKSTKGSKIYAVVKGVLDGNMNINCKKEMLPPEERIQGKHLKKDFSNIFNKIKENILKEK